MCLFIVVYGDNWNTSGLLGHSEAHDCQAGLQASELIRTFTYRCLHMKISSSLRITRCCALDIWGKKKPYPSPSSQKQSSLLSQSDNSIIKIGIDSLRSADRKTVSRTVPSEKGKGELWSQEEESKCQVELCQGQADSDTPFTMPPHGVGGGHCSSMWTANS